MALPARMRVLWRDFNGRRALTLLHALPTTTDENFITGLGLWDALSAAAQVTARIERVIDGPNPESGADGAYATHRDVALIEARTDAGEKPTVIPVPAPLASLLLQDLQNLDPDNVDLQAFMAWVAEFGTNWNNVPVLEYLAGHRTFIPKTPY